MQVPVSSPYVESLDWHKIRADREEVLNSFCADLSAKDGDYAHIFDVPPCSSFSELSLKSDVVYLVARGGVSCCR